MLNFRVRELDAMLASFAPRGELAPETQDIGVSPIRLGYRS